MNFLSSLFSVSEEACIEWQKLQTLHHFSSNNIWQTYRNIQSDKIFISKSSVCRENTNISKEVFIYCFGDYAQLIVNQPLDDQFSYYSMLIELYECGKGSMRRYIWGDPLNIKILRKAVNTRNYDCLSEIDFDSDKYNYTAIHAHTLVQNSLSKFITCLIGNALYWTNGKSTFHFEEDMCEKSYTNEMIIPKLKIIEPINNKTEKSNAIIAPRKNKSEDDLFIPKSWPKSWPRDKNSNKILLKCEECKKNLKASNFKHECS